MRLILGTAAVLFGWTLAHGAGAATIPQEVQGRWSPEGTCAADEPVLTFTETTFQLAEYGGVRRVEVQASGDARTALRLRVVRVLADTSVEPVRVKVGDEVALRLAGGKLLTLRVVNGRAEPGSSLPLNRCR
jgi:hypothetical protein